MHQPHSIVSLPQAPTPPHEAFKVLIAEDGKFDRSILAIEMRRCGYQVLEACNGEEALMLYQSFQPDILLIDGIMPGLDGFECCRRLRQLPGGVRIPVVMITALDNTYSVDQAFASGADDYVTKPVHWAVLRQRVRHLLHRQLLSRQLQALNDSLEQKVLQRTADLAKSLYFEGLLKKITDKVRDNLDQDQVLTSVVQSLTVGLNLACCDAALYNLDRRESWIKYEDSPGLPSSCGQMVQMKDFPGIYQQLLQGESFQFTLSGSKAFRPVLRDYTIFVCPIMGDEGVIGDLWLFRRGPEVFSQLETRLVEQVANQCTIALRQARFYQLSQTQVRELEHLHQLKNDFLSTVSHELRSPIANIKMAAQLLQIIFQEGNVPEQASQYLQILKTEADREMNLINDILDLQHLNAGEYPLDKVQIHWQEWIIPLIESVQASHLQSGQTLEVDICPHLPPITTSVFSLTRILTELLTNACKYTPPGGKITVKTHLVGGKFRTEVRNMGVEILPQDLEQIFEKFYRAPQPDPYRYSGTGLGLHLVQKLTGHLGGTILARSGPGYTSFVVELPLP